MSYALYPLAAACGAVVGAAAHEATHAFAAVAFGVLEGVGWRGGIAGGPYVDFAPETRVQSEIVRKAPLAVGLGLLAVVVLTYQAPTLPWVTAAAATLGVLWTSPEDLFFEAAQRD